MSTEIRLGDVYFNLADHPGDDPSSGEIATERRVAETNQDRPHTETLPVMADPAADHVDPDLMQRRADIDEKHRRVVEFLDRNGYDAALLGRADSVSWFTAGGDLRRDLGSSESSSHLFINRQCRAIFTDNVQSPQIFEEEVAGLGFHLKERPWHEPLAASVAALCRSKKVVADAPAPGLIVDRDGLGELRLALSKLERQRLRELGRTVTLCVEATCRNFHPGETEADLAGHLAHRFFREGVTPVDLRVAGDDRPGRYRNASFKSAPINRLATITAVGRRHGLCAAVTRMVCFGPVPPEIREAHALVSMIEATAIYFSRPGQSVADVFRRVRRIYEKFGRPHEWTLAYQGSIIGYQAVEVPLMPESGFPLRPNLPIRWTPSVGPARSEDTVVVDERGFEVVTEAQRWPKVDVMVKGFTLPRPGILER